MSSTREQTLHLPQDVPGQVYISVKVLSLGTFYLPEIALVKDGSLPSNLEEWTFLPAFAFLLSHPAKGKVMFDLGIRKDGIDGYPPANRRILTPVRPKCEQDAADLLRNEGIDPADIKQIIYSHLHWDHIGDPEPFTTAEFVMGAKTKTLLDDAYPKNPDSWYPTFPEDRRIVYVDFDNPSPFSVAEPFGPFDRAVDLYGDGSLYLIDSPGHVQGHLMAAARVGPNTFAFLAGDTCHSRKCYCGSDIHETSDKLHENWEVAQNTVDKLVKLDRECPDALVILAHEVEREKEMPFFPKELNDWAVNEVEKRRMAAGRRT